MYGDGLLKTLFRDQETWLIRWASLPITGLCNFLPPPPAFPLSGKISPQLLGNGVDLKWTITNQVNVASYTVQRSTDGHQYLPIAIIAPYQDIGSALIYHYTDLLPPTGEAYYRILQTDLDGKSSYSAVKLVRYNQTVMAVRAFPNPFG